MTATLKCGCKISDDGERDYHNPKCTTTSGGCQYWLAITIINNAFKAGEQSEKEKQWAMDEAKQ